MPQGGQNLSASRWATTTRSTSSFKKHHDSHTYSSTSSTIGSTTSTSSSKLGSATDLSKTPLVETAKLTPAQKDFLSRSQSYEVFSRYSRRLKWKSTALCFSHQRTLTMIHDLNTTPSNVIGGTKFQMQREEPETMFKIDFFEFYTILENVLVNLLGVFGMEISPIYAPDVREINGDGLRQKPGFEGTGEEHVQRNSLIGDSKAIQKSRHSYHANVLIALDKDSCPLKPIMGQGSVRDYLGIAKEWRNKWKNIEDEGKDERVDGLVGSRYEKLINDLRLEEMLRDILVAIEQGDSLAQHTLKSIYEDLNREGLSSAAMDIDQQPDELVEMLPGDIMEWD